MRRSPPPRHLLVIAPQCAALGRLTGLEETAGALRDALMDPGSDNGRSWRSRAVPTLLAGPDVKQAEIEKAVRDAANRAGAAAAVLVLAFLGHGTVLGQAPRLSFMAGDSDPDRSTSVVDVGHLLNQALDVHGVQEVIAVVDTCHAGGAVPDLGMLATGVRQGATRLSLLMAVGATESAYGLAFTRTLTRVLTDGLPGAGELLTATEVRDAVNKDAGTDARLLIFDGMSAGPDPWFARNARHAGSGGTFLGALGEEDLRTALAPLGEADPPFPVSAFPVSDLFGLRRLRQALDSQDRPPAGAAHDLAYAYALRTVDRLADAVETCAFLSSSWPGAPLESDRIRRAYVLAAGRPAPDCDGDELLRVCVESLCLRVPLATGSATAPLTAFVAALAVEDGLERGTRRLTRWARNRGAGVELTDAFAAQEQQAADSRLRLVVSLHAAVADEWPETLLAWLFDGDTLIANGDFRCPATQLGVEAELAGVLAWAARLAGRTGLRLKRVDVAASSARLASWRPEEIRLSRRLGVHYDVVLRWSERLSLPAHLALINYEARSQLDAMRTGPGAPVDWLGTAETSAMRELMDRLSDGWYERALALSHRPERLTELLDPLLAYAPIVLWPDRPGDLPAAARDTVERNWGRLPGEFCTAYRASWRQGAGREDPAEDHVELARVRSVWLDEQWLDFCDWFETHSVDGENAQ